MVALLVLIGVILHHFMVIYNTLTNKAILDSYIIFKSMVKASSSIKMVKYMKDTGIIIKGKAKASLYIKMAIIMMDNGKTIINMAKACFNVLTANQKKAIGKTIRLLQVATLKNQEISNKVSEFYFILIMTSMMASYKIYKGMAKVF